MNKSSSSASSSPPFTTLPPLSTTAPSTVTSHRTSPSVIPLEYNYRIMSPSSLSLLRQHTASNATRSTRPQTATTQLDTPFDAGSQYNSLFGDPVPPPPPSDFLGSQFDSRAAHLFHTTTMEINGSSEEEAAYEPPMTLENPRRLFSNVPYTSLLSRRSSNISVEHNFDSLSTTLPRLQPPDIQILPNSSGGSSAGDARDSPNYALLAPEDVFRRQTVYDIGEPADVSEYSETVTINDASGVREYSEATRRMSNFSAKVHESALDDVSTTGPTLGRQFSNESYSSSEWFRPSMNNFPEFSKMPKLRPSSKNVMSIKREEMPPQHSPVAAMINDSNGSSSGGEERLLNTTQTLAEPTVSLDILTPQRPPEPSSALLRELDEASQRSSPDRRRSSVVDTSTAFSPSPPAAPPPPSPRAPESYTDPMSELQAPIYIKREKSPVILRESIATGSDYRVDNLRLHKKTSFTIISDRSAQSSRAQTPTNYIQHYSSPQSNTFSQALTPTPTPTITTPTPAFDSNSKPTVKPRHHLHRKSLTATELRVPQLHIMTQLQPSDDSPRPSVQFDMSGRYSPGKMPQKGILQHRESLSSSQETPLPTQSTPLAPPVPRRRPSVLPALPIQDQRKMSSYETLPLITDPYRTAIPRLHRSSFDLREHAVFPPGALPRPLKPNPNPTRKQRGLLRVINSAESLSRIPLRSNWATSADELRVGQRRRSSLSTLDLPMRRRSSSTSPERRSSTQTASDRRSSNLSSVTTSDFSFRRPSLSNIQPQAERRKSVFHGTKSTPTTPRRRQSIVTKKNQNRAARPKISKPTTLSPIIGTPNKDSSSPQSPVRNSALKTLLNASETLSDSTSRRESLSKIPVRSGVHSRSNSRLSSHSGSQAPSRSGSPVKELLIQSPVSGRTSRTASNRSPSRATVRNDSRPASRSDSRAMISRSSSRASTRPISHGPASVSSSRPNSRTENLNIFTGSRPNSRMEQYRDIANSRSNSRVSMRSPVGRATSVSPMTGRKRSNATFGRRKSVSLSPKAMRRLGAKRQSVSPTTKKRGTTSGKSLERRRSQSRIPTRTKSDLGSAGPPRSSSKSKGIREDPKRSVSARRTVSSQSRKEPTSAKKAPTSVRKPESSVKRTASSVAKPPTTATKKQPSNLQKTEKNLKRETLQNTQKKPSNVTGSATTTTTTKTITTTKTAKTATATATANAKSSASASASASASGKSGTRKQETSAPRKKTGSETKELKKQNSSKQLVKSSDATAATGSKSAGSETAATANGSGVSAATENATALDDSSTIAATAAATGALMSGMKRQPSTMTLIRMGSRLSLLSRKRPDSSLSRHITEEVEESGDITGEETNATGTEQLHKVSSAGQLATADGLPAVILEKSQKTLENIQKTVTVATDEIHRKINENLTDLKSLEQDMGRVSDGAVSPTASITTVVENQATKTHQPPGQPIEASVSILNSTSSTVDGGGAIAAERNFELGIEDKHAGVGGGTNAADGVDASALTDEPSSSSGVDGIGKHRQSPDGQGGSSAGSDGGRTGSRELLEAPDEDSPKGCCRCCARFCMPCRRARCSRCCHRKKKLDHNTDEAEDRPVLSATSSTTTTNLEVIDEKTGKKKNGCWQKLNCFKKKNKDQLEGEVINEEISKISETTHAATPPLNMGPTVATPKQGKCGACLRKIFCCRTANKVETTTTDDEEHAKKKCTCFPCCRKKTIGSESGSRAWQDPEQGITGTDAADGVTSAMTEGGCCKRFWRKVFCCCRKKQAPVPSSSRRASMKAPPPLAEDTRRKLHNDLVEYTSKMKGAIPVLPLYLAWFCAICNTIFPGLGTLFSGIFCICVGIPRFSQFDSAKARLGSFIINTIVAAAQLFCVLFCFVGWGWSIWWGTIMLKCARKLNKIRKVERLEMEEEQRQAAAATAAAKAEVIHATGTGTGTGTGTFAGTTETTKT